MEGDLNGMGGGTGLDEQQPCAFELMRSERPNFHVFEERGEWLLYDPCSGTILSVNASVGRLLASVESGADANALAKLAEDEGLNRGSLNQELLELYALGLFRAEEPESPHARGRTLAALRAHKQRNLMLMVHTACNLACSYCYEVGTGFHGSGGAMSLERAIEIVEDYIERSGDRRQLAVTFFGGEPLLNFPVIVEVVKYLKRRGVELGKTFGWSLTTNGTLLTKERVDYLVREGFTVMVSLDGDPQRADRHRIDLAGKGATKRALEGAERLVQAQRKADQREATIRATLSAGNESKRDIEVFLKGRGFRRIMVGEASGRPHEDPAWALSPEAIEGLGREHDETITEHFRLIDAGEDSPHASAFNASLGRIHEALSAPGAKGAHIGCGIGRNMLAVSAEGEAFPCHRFAGDKAFSLGKIQDGGLDTARLERMYNELLDVSASTCSKCWARFLCGGRCPWYLARPDGSIAAPDKAGCDGLRRGFEKQLWMYKETVARQATMAPAEAHDSASPPRVHALQANN